MSCPEAITQAIAAHPCKSRRFDFPIEDSEATRQATSNFKRNRAAIESVWHRTALALPVALPEALPEFEWLFARDGALSARTTAGRWFNDLSVPRRSAERMLTKIGTSGTTVVFLAPTHAAQLRRMLDLLPSTHALIAVVPGELNAGVIIACEDFSADIATGRLWLAVGPDWSEELKEILNGNAGLMPPTTMVRVPGLNAPVVELISRSCDGLLSNHARAQKQLVSMSFGKLRAPRRPVKQACVVAGAFGLWNDAASLLCEAAKRSSIDCVTVNQSAPTQASDLFLAKAVEGCDVIVTANIGRSDRPGLVPDNVPWVTWATGADVPARVASAKQDRLILATEAMTPAALSAGWTTAQLSIASEPWHERPAQDSASSPKIHERGAHATSSLILDLPSVAPPPSIEEMSSLRLVWELIERDLIAKPLRNRGTVDAFIIAAAEQVGVARESIPMETFRHGLVLPVFARELALELARHNVDFAIFGDGWQTLTELRSRWRGPIASSEAFESSLASTAAVIDVWPGLATHRSRRVGRPLVAAWGQSVQTIVAGCRTSALVPKASRSTIFDLDSVLGQLSADE